MCNLLCHAGSAVSADQRTLYTESGRESRTWDYGGSQQSGGHYIHCAGIVLPDVWGLYFDCLYQSETECAAGSIPVSILAINGPESDRKQDCG